MGVIGDCLQQFTVDVQTQFISLTNRQNAIGLLTRPDGERGGHSITVASEDLQVAAVHTPEDGIIPVGADSEVVEILYIHVAT